MEIAAFYTISYGLSALAMRHGLKSIAKINAEINRIKSSNVLIRDVNSISCNKILAYKPKANEYIRFVTIGEIECNDIPLRYVFGKSKPDLIPKYPSTIFINPEYSFETNINEPMLAGKFLYNISDVKMSEAMINLISPNKEHQRYSKYLLKKAFSNPLVKVRISNVSAESVYMTLIKNNDKHIVDFMTDDPEKARTHLIERDVPSRSNSKLLFISGALVATFLTYRIITKKDFRYGTVAGPGSRVWYLRW